MSEEIKNIELKDEDLIKVSDGVTNGMCGPHQKLSPRNCLECAGCIYCVFTGECNELNTHALCKCTDLNKEFWVSMNQYPGIINKTEQ